MAVWQIKYFNEVNCSKCVVATAPEVFRLNVLWYTQCVIIAPKCNFSPGSALHTPY